MRVTETLYVGCAGWNVPTNNAEIDASADVGQNRGSGQPAIEDQAEAARKKRKSHLERYTAFFSAVEINSSFYHAHLPATYAKWRKTVPPDFRFSVKFPRTVSNVLPTWPIK